MHILTTYIKRYLGLLVLTVSIIFSVITSMQYVLPKINEIQSLRSTIESQQTQKEELSTYSSYLEELASSSLDVEESVVNYALPSENDVVSLIITYEGLATAENITVSPFNLSPGLIRKKTVPKSQTGQDADTDTTAAATENPNGVKELEFEMKTETEQPEVGLAFMKEIYTTRRAFTIKSLTWTNPKPEDDDKNIKIDFKLVTYYFENAPKGIGSRELVLKGKSQGDFIQKLTESKVYDQLVLDGVPIGKEDLFVLNPDLAPQKKTESVATGTADLIPLDTTPL